MSIKIKYLSIIILFYYYYLLLLYIININDIIIYIINY